MDSQSPWAATVTRKPSCAAPPGRLSAALAEAFAQARLAVRRDPAAAEHWLGQLERLLLEEGAPLSARATSIKTGCLAPWQLNRVLRYVESNIGERLRIAELAAIVRLSEHYFARALKNTVGTPPHAYVTERRIRNARRLILETDLPLSQVALEVGLVDQPHLSRLFRRFFGGTPSACRRLNRWPAETSETAAFEAVRTHRVTLALGASHEAAYQ
ncbi:MAG TPA: AraC family transcriptional regulator [Caulobacteraceae bacterium]|nr:AraC family transcriptional regulator [Caulobacteraceae bacterium]